MREMKANILREGFEEFQQFINPMIAQRAKMAGEPIQVVRARDGVLLDTNGHEFEDFHGTQMLGHRNRAISDALREFLDSDAPNWFPSRVNPWAGRLARRLCERSGYTNAYFGLSGADAVEAALKLARAATGKPRIIGLEGGYHGCTYGAVSLMHRGPLHDPFGPHLQGAEKIPFGDIDSLARALAPEDVCAVVVEPIQGEGGVRALPAPFIDALCELTAKHGALLVSDEVQTAFGRSGSSRFLASETWPRKPDVALIAKTLGGGLMPISAMLTQQDIFNRAYGRNFYAGESHNCTFSYNALSCVAALTTLDLITDELMSAVAEQGANFKARLEESLGGNRYFEEARGSGFMLGIKLRQPDHPWLSFEYFGWPELNDHPTIGPLLCYRLYRRGFIAYCCGHDWSILRLQPRFNIEPEKLNAFAKIIREELDQLCKLA